MDSDKKCDGKITRGDRDARIVVQLAGSCWTKRYWSVRDALADALHLGLFTERLQAENAHKALAAVCGAEFCFVVPKPYDVSALWNRGFLAYEVQSMRRTTSSSKKFSARFA